MNLKKDRRNYRIHDETNKRIIGKSLDECGAGRSILADSSGEIIAGNGVFEQAQKRGIKTRLVETDGSELVVVVRKDIAPGDEKRKLLALADNAASDTSAWNAELLRQDWEKQDAAEWGLDTTPWECAPREFRQPGKEAIEIAGEENLPEEISGQDIMPDALPDTGIREEVTERGRIIITYPWERQADVERLLGLKANKILFRIEEILGE